jgi:hypothetical protein
MQDESVKTGSDVFICGHYRGEIAFSRFLGIGHSS